jgi:hypothetical protein
VGQTSRSRIFVPIERSCHKKNTYEIPIIYHSKDMANVEVFEKWVKLQGQGHRVKNLVPTERFCHKEHTNEIPITCHQKIWTMLKFLKSG